MRETAQVTGPHEADGKSNLAAGRTGQELAERHEIGIGLFVEPAAANDKLRAEIADMSDRAAKAGKAEPEEDQENFERRASLTVPGRRKRCGDRRGVIVAFVSYPIPTAYA
jgi:hypothetical protein